MKCEVFGSGVFVPLNIVGSLSRDKNLMKNVKVGKAALKYTEWSGCSERDFMIQQSYFLQRVTSQFKNQLHYSQTSPDELPWFWNFTSILNSIWLPFTNQAQKENYRESREIEGCATNAKFDAFSISLPSFAKFPFLFSTSNAAMIRWISCNVFRLNPNVLHHVCNFQLWFSFSIQFQCLLEMFT